MEDELSHRAGLTAQHLLGEVITDEPVTPADLVDEPLRVVAAGQGQGRQIDRGRPALGVLDQFRHCAGRQVDVLGGEQRRRRVGVEAESIGPDLGQLSGRS